MTAALAVRPNAPLLEPHPLSDLVPEMTHEEYDLLLADIHEHGVLMPVILYEGKILDGRHRYRATYDLADKGVIRKPTFQEFKGTDAEAASYVISLNIHRRHLTTGQRAMIAVPLMKAFQAETGQGTRTDLTSGNSARSERPREVAAAAVNVSPRSVQQAATLLEEAPELAEQVRNGHMELWQAAATRKKAAEADKPEDDGLPLAPHGVCRTEEVMPADRPERTAVVTVPASQQDGEAGTYLVGADPAEPGTDHTLVNCEVDQAFQALLSPECLHHLDLLKLYYRADQWTYAEVIERAIGQLCTIKKDRLARLEP